VIENSQLKLHIASYLSRWLFQQPPFFCLFMSLPCLVFSSSESTPSGIEYQENSYAAADGLTCIRSSVSFRIRTVLFIFRYGIVLCFIQCRTVDISTFSSRENSCGVKYSVCCIYTFLPLNGS